MKELMKTSDTNKIQFIISNLSSHELDIAARASSYEYHQQLRQRQQQHAFNCGNERSSDNDTTDQNNIQYASIMIKRYLQWNDNNPMVALEKLKETIRFRNDMDIDALIQAHTDERSMDYSPLRQHLSYKKEYVQGYDRYGRSTYYLIPRRNIIDEQTAVYTKKVHIWTIERAIACSKAQDKTVNAIIDCNGFNPTIHCPPYHIGKDIVTTLKNHYITNIHGIYLINPPTSFLCMWSLLFKHIAGKRTASKIHFIHTTSNNNKNNNQVVNNNAIRYNGRRGMKRGKQKQVQATIRHHYSDSDDEGANYYDSAATATSTKCNNFNILEKLYTNDQVPSWMIPSGTKNRELDVDEYLDQIPFNQAFDE